MCLLLRTRQLLLHKVKVGDPDYVGRDDAVSTYGRPISTDKTWRYTGYTVILLADSYRRTVWVNPFTALPHGLYSM